MSSLIVPTKSAIPATIKKRSAGQFEGTICCGEEEQEEYYDSEDEEEEENQDEGEESSIDQGSIETAVNPTTTVPTSLAKTKTKDTPKAKTTTTTKTPTPNNTTTTNPAILAALEESSKTIINSVTYKYQKAATKAKNIDVITDQLTTGRLPSDLSVVHSINSQQVSPNESFADVYKKLAADEKAVLRTTCNNILTLRQTAHQFALTSLLNDVEQKTNRDKILADLRNRARKIDPDSTPEEDIMRTANAILTACGEARTNFNTVRAKNIREFATKQRLYDLRIARQAAYAAAQEEQPAPRKPAQMTSYYQRTDDYNYTNQTNNNNHASNNQTNNNNYASKNPRREPDDAPNNHDTQHTTNDNQERPNTNTKVRAPNEQPNHQPNNTAPNEQPNHQSNNKAPNDQPYYQTNPNNTSPQQNNANQAQYPFTMPPANQMVQGTYNPFVPNAGFHPNNGFWMPNPNYQFPGLANNYDNHQHSLPRVQDRQNMNPSTPNRKNNKA